MLLYIDPGTGSMLFSLAISLVSVGWFGARKLYMELKYRALGKAPAGDAVPLVVFSDDKRYWPVFEPIVRELDNRAFDVTYMTQSPDDPALEADYPHLHAEFIGEGNKAFAKLNFLKATMVLSTTPGLDVYQWKRSKDVGTYIHIPHAPGELTTYRMFGVDFYDALLLSGQCQVDDCRLLEALRDEPEKECRIVGIPYLDEKVRRLASRGDRARKGERRTPTILIAPSWGSNSLLNRFGRRLIDQLTSLDYHIIIRPHPQSFISEKQMIEEMMGEYPDLEWNRDNDNFEVLARSDLMISDFSGVIFDYSLVFDKPVICAYTDFDDSEYDAWWLETPIWTATAVPRLGPILSEENLDDIGTLIESAMEDESYETARHEVCEEIWCHRGEGARRVADYLVEKYGGSSQAAAEG